VPADLKLTMDGDVYEIDTAEVLSDLTGEETIELEDFLGGWKNFDTTGESARSLIVLVWLARRGNGQKVSIKDVSKEKGILFGDRIEIEDVEPEEGSEVPPADAADAEAATPSTPQDPSADSGTGD